MKNLLGQDPPEMRCPPPGERSRRIAVDLERHEAPGINTLYRGRPGPVWAEAVGVNVVDADGNRYLDLTAGFGVAAVGHRHPRVVAALSEQSGRLIHGLGDVHAHPLRRELAGRLAARAPVGTPDDPPQVYFGISGSEAVEIALKTAFLATEENAAPRTPAAAPAVVAFDPAYHGLTLGSLALTSRPAFREPFAPWLGLTVHRLPFGGPPAELDRLLGHRPEIRAVVFEPVVGREGGLFPPPGWLSEICAVARRHQVPTVADEVFTGFGRTGYWFAVEADGARPDLLVCGKALGGGLPIAAVIGRRDLLAAWATPGEALHTATFVAHPLACATALAVLDVLEEDDLPARAARLGEHLGPRLRRLANPAGPLTAVRGRGLLWALDLATPEVAGRLAGALLRRGVLALAGGARGRTLQIAPPLIIARPLLDLAADLLEDALSEISRSSSTEDLR